MTYTHLISISLPNRPLQIKEWLDIALVSASYDVPTALFLDEKLIAELKNQPHIEIIQALNLLADFSIPMFSQQADTLYQQTIEASSLISLQRVSQHHLSF